MNYIINPSWFYWANVLTALNIVCYVLAIISGIILAIVIIGSTIDLCFDDFKKMAVICAIVFTISVLGAIFIPTEETMLKIMIAKYATKENLNITVDGIKSAVDYIVNAMKEIKG